MTLATGDTLGPYKILGLLGSGGMGEVYRAHDDRLRRDVAIKVSNAEFTERFTQEARAIASLNHTNICHLYDVGPNYLVMELVEGEVLRGPLTFDDALPIILQLIDGIEAAHERNIIHRDLKPANIKITPDGVVKILDFGLAKALDVTSSSDTNPENSPTMTVGATVVGAILGTAAYMSPEQARGKTADKRSDIWSFGVILHEILTGTRPFQGESIVEILGSVLNKDPDLSKAPARAQRLLRWCLERDRKLRLQAIGDARRLLTEAAPMDAVASAATPSGGPLKWAPWITAAAALAVAAFSFTRPAPERVADVARFTVSLPQGRTLPGRFDSGAVAVSPDGRSIVFVEMSGSGTTMQLALWVRAVDSFAAQKLANTEGGRQPFWSPDSKHIAFFAADDKLKRIPATGGVPLVIGPAPQPGGGTWFQTPDDPEGVILFGTSALGGTIRRVPASGNGLPEAVTRSEKGERHTFPQVLPDGLRFLFLEDGSDRPVTYVQKFGDIDQRTLLAEGPSVATFAPPNYLLTQRDGILLAQPWDWDQLKSKGEPVPIADGLPNARRPFSVSTSGTLAQRKDIAGAVHQYRWFKRDGTPEGPALTLPEGEWSDVDLSPDNMRAVVARRVGVNSGDLYLVEFSSGVVSRLTSDGRSKIRLAWSPDSRRVVYATTGSEIYQTVVGSGKSTLVHTAPGGAGHLAWLKDGILITGRTGPMLLPTPDENATTAITAQPRALTDRPGGPHRVSPDGRWVAYVTQVEGVWELWVAAFPSFTDHRKVTSDAVGPRWRGDGKELIFVSEDRGLMSVDVKPGPTFEFTSPKPLFNPDDAQINGPSNYAVTSDGQRFLLRVSAPASAAGEQIYVVLNWPKLLVK